MKQQGLCYYISPLFLFFTLSFAALNWQVIQQINQGPTDISSPVVQCFPPKSVGGNYDCLIAAGSTSARIPGFGDAPVAFTNRVWKASVKTTDPKSITWTELNSEGIPDHGRGSFCRSWRSSANTVDYTGCLSAFGIINGVPAAQALNDKIVRYNISSQTYSLITPTGYSWGNVTGARCDEIDQVIGGVRKRVADCFGGFNVTVLDFTPGAIDVNDLTQIDLSTNVIKKYTPTGDPVTARHHCAAKTRYKNGNKMMLIPNGDGFNKLPVDNVTECIYSADGNSVACTNLNPEGKYLGCQYVEHGWTEIWKHSSLPDPELVDTLNKDLFACGDIASGQSASSETTLDVKRYLINQEKFNSFPEATEDLGDDFKLKQAIIWSLPEDSLYMDENDPQCFVYGFGFFANSTHFFYPNKFALFCYNEH